MNSLDFTEEEIREQLAVLGYRNIPKHRLLEFKKDLDELILHPEFRHLASPPQCRSTKPLKPAYTHPSLPVVTKEKVSLCFKDGFFLHANQSNHQRQVLTPCHNREYGQGEGLLDSYAQHSVVPKLQPAVAAPSRLWAEPEIEAEPDSRHHPPLSDSYLSSPDSQGGRLIKRKVLRKLGGQSLIYEESIYSENSADTTSSLEERLADLRLTPSPRRDPESDEEDEEEGEEEEERRSSDSLSSGISVDAFETYYRSMTHSDAGIRRKPKSFIRPLANQPAIKKTDPVTKYFQYKQIWEMFKLPGQREHRALRQEIRERLAYQPPPPKPRRMFIPNTYEVPTEKKRSALRWEVRNDLANGLMPCRVSYRF